MERQSGEKCQSQFLKAQGGIFPLLVLSDQQSQNQKIFILLPNYKTENKIREKQQVLKIQKLIRNLHKHSRRTQLHDTCECVAELT